ncbi:protein LEAD-SENSITIVE 1-like [Ziziphus jujuba]|uniref:Protein LEAD-SENSITIVE 1-like n=1 Tax=Ziziphus jujuba TaxID=326968 RepID=A0ABM3II69_ZIZJJ|nr:protein LEAD-SENSITIVE 1-like [Ziziphus jujuba]
MRGVSLWKKIQREELKTGDHIYALRGADTKVHHGTYANDTNVIHFCRGACSDNTCPTCSDFYRVTSSCLDCFLYGGDLYRFEYGVTPANFVAKFGRGCTLASKDKAEDVIDRASFFLEYGSPAHHRYINNGEDFGIYCKTGLLVVDMINFSKTWQIAYFLALTAALFLSLQQLMLVSFTGLAARFLGLCCVCIFASDIELAPMLLNSIKYTD